MASLDENQVTVERKSDNSKKDQRSKKRIAGKCNHCGKYGKPSEKKDERDNAVAVAELPSDEANGSDDDIALVGAEDQEDIEVMMLEAAKESI